MVSINFNQHEITPSNFFVEQINLAEALTSSDMGISCGLFSQSYKEYFRHYSVNIERYALTIR